MRPIVCAELEVFVSGSSPPSPVWPNGSCGMTRPDAFVCRSSGNSRSYGHNEGEAQRKQRISTWFRNGSCFNYRKIQAGHEERAGRGQERGSDGWRRRREQSSHQRAGKWFGLVSG